jgi:hypothetical protein
MVNKKIKPMTNRKLEFFLWPIKNSPCIFVIKFVCHVTCHLPSEKQCNLCQRIFKLYEWVTKSIFWFKMSHFKFYLFLHLSPFGVLTYPYTSFSHVTVILVFLENLLSHRISMILGEKQRNPYFVLRHTNSIDSLFFLFLVKGTQPTLSIPSDNGTLHNKV